MSNRSRTLFFAFSAMCLLIACSKDPVIPDERPLTDRQPVLPAVPYSYNDTLPSWLSSPALTSYLQNAITDEGATLGRVLFYDKKLSQNNKISCGSCHRQENGFSDNRNFSFGFQGGHTARNAMAIVNTRFSQDYFWDQRISTIESQVLMPVQNSVEMGMGLADLPEKLEKTEYYPGLFEKAFGTKEITVNRISIALGEFVQSISSYRSRYDQGKPIGFSNFNSQETDGMNLFFGGTVNCSQCHATDNFYNTTAFNNGLDSIYTDNGIGAVTGNPAQNGLFKTPSLRNIAVTAPYMHDGRFATLEEVVEHYNSGIQQHPNLSGFLTTDGLSGGPPKRFYLSASQEAAIVAFLKTLTDQPLLNDVRFSDPFK
jgi:cytochrome c peroxidase